MSFNPSPTGYFPGIQCSASGVFIPYSNFESYKVGTSGDIRELIYSFIEKVSDVYSDLVTADQSTQTTIRKSSTIPVDNVIRNIYTVTINLSYSGLYVEGE